MSDTPAATSDFVPPHPGSKLMPRWDGGELPRPPIFRWQNWLAFLGPGLVSGASAIGGGEWLTGPLVTAKYGGALFWLATLSILGQVIYNMEISRYTLYSGEPIFTGKFRSLPGPLFWLFVYLVLDFGSILPYLASQAATPVAMVYLKLSSGASLDPKLAAHQSLLQYLSYGIFLLAVVPLVFGGKVYNSLKAAMSFKLVFVVGFLIFIAIRFSSAATWGDICSGFFKFGTFPVVQSETDAGAEWDGESRDGKLEGVEKRWTNKPMDFEDADGDGRYDGYRTANIFIYWWQGKPFPAMELSMFAVLGAMAGLAGTGGLTNTNISSYTRDQGWGMGAHVGAIPSAFGGHSVKLSHMGMVFPINKDSVARFRAWYRHVLRDQLIVWMPACFIGLALPSMLSVQFLPRGLESSTWTAAGMTAEGVEKAVAPVYGPTLGVTFWFTTLFCGFIILALSNTSTADGYFRRWVDVVWTGLPALRNWDPRRAGQIYFGFLCVYVVGGLVMLTVVKGDNILPIATTIYNCALGFSCFHVLYLNLTLLPRELKPSWKVRIMMTLAGAFFMCVSTAQVVGMIAENKAEAAATKEARAEYRAQNPAKAANK
jgi:hypothetical protein